MSIQRHDYRTQSPQKYGKPGVSYPYGDPRWPRIVETRTSKKGPENPLLAPLTPHRDQKSYPGALLIDQQSDPGDDTDKNVTETYEVLPGPVFLDIVPDAELGIPVMTSRQRRAATDTWVCGEIVPVAFTIAGATIAAQTTVTLAAPHDFVMGEYVVGAGTANTTPTMNGTFQVVAIPTPSSVTLALDVTAIAGTIGGTLKRYAYVYRERHKTENLNVVEKVETRAAVADVTAYNQSTEAFRPYPFPDALIEILGYSSDSDGSTTETTAWGYSYSWSGGVGFKILNGFRGDCKATRLRLFTMGPVSALPNDPDTGQPYKPTVVMPATGTVTVGGGAASLTETTTGETTSTSASFKGERIPPVLTAAFSGVITSVGTGDAVFNVDLPDSIPTGFTQGDIITTIDPPEKLRGIGVCMTTIWRIVVPYTTGVGPA